MSLSERFNRPLEYFTVQKNIINILALIELLSITGEMRDEQMKKLLQLHGQQQN